MNEIVRETICTHCIHRNVCSIKKSYLETLEKLPDVDHYFRLILSCNHHQKEVSNPRDNSYKKYFESDTARTFMDGEYM